MASVWTSETSVIEMLCNTNKATALILKDRAKRKSLLMELSKEFSVALVHTDKYSKPNY